MRRALWLRQEHSEYSRAPHYFTRRASLAGCGGFSGSAIPPTPAGLGNAQSPPKSNPRAPNPRPRTPTSDQEAPKTHPNGFQQRPSAKIEPTWPQGACTPPPKKSEVTPPKIIDDQGFRPERGGERKGRGNITLTHRTPRGRWMTESALQACLKLIAAPQGQNKGGSSRGG